MKKARWGIVSTGNIADQFCQDFSFVHNGELVAVAARNIEDAEKFADKHQIPTAYQGYQALFDDPDIDVIYVATPHTLHYQNTLDALNAGKSVLCEKPFTISAQQCNGLTALAQEKGLFLMEAMWTYFLPAIKQAQTWVAQGKIGEIKHVKADFGYPMPYDPKSRAYNVELAGGCLLDMGIYPLAIAQLFLGKNLTSAEVVGQRAPNGVDNDVVLMAKFQTNNKPTLATLATSFQCKLPNYAYIIGTKGYIALPNFWMASECQLFEGDNLVEHFSDDRASIGFNYEAIAVSEYLLNNKIESEVVSHETSLWLQKWLTEIKNRC